MFKQKIIVCLIVLVCAAAPVGANMVKDGSFEFGDTGEDRWISVAGDGETFGAWTAHTTGSYAVWLLVDSVDGVMGGAWIIPDGVEAVHIGDSWTFGYITQVISGFNVGQTYEVSLAAIAYTDSIPPWGTLEIYDPLNPGVYDLQVDFDASQPGSGGEFLYSSFEFAASATELELSIINPADPGDSALNIDDVSIKKMGPHVGITESGGSTEVQEASGSDSYQLVLSEVPSSNVTVTANHDSQIETTPSILTFTSGNWDTAQTITVTAVDDRLAEGIHSSTITHTVGGDPDYVGTSISNVEVSIADNDWAGDVNQNGSIGLDDLLALASRWLDDCFPIDWCDGADLSAVTGATGEPGKVDLVDYAMLTDRLNEKPFYISEFMASNGSDVPLNAGEILDGNGESSDWIEIHNAGSILIDLGGYYLTDNCGNLTKWEFPAGISINAGGHLIVFASGKDQAAYPGNYPYLDPGGYYHTNFKLSSGGECLVLVQPDGQTIVNDYNFPPQERDISYGLYNEMIRYFGIPTPGGPNNDGYIGMIADTKFRHDRGFYDSPFDAVLTCETEGATIHYTLDNSEPTESDPYFSTNPVTINGTTCLRARAFKPGWLPSNVDSHTYIFLDDVLTQTHPAGFPSSWYGTSADYDMDSSIVDANIATIKDDMNTIPTLSLVMEYDDLFDPSTGLYINSWNRVSVNGPEWEKPGSLELIYPDGKEGFNVNCGIRMFGWASRTVKKKAFRAVFKAQYGPTMLEYDLFPKGLVDRFNTLIIRNGDDNWLWSYIGNKAQFIRDQWAKDTELAMGRQGIGGIYVNLYVNGMYWGMYNIFERPDAAFMAEHYGGEREQYDAYNGRTGSVQTTDGTMDSWNTALGLANGGLATQVAYDEFCQWVDVVDLADYYLLNIYNANTDWPGYNDNNWRAARHRVTGGQMKFFSWDTDASLSCGWRGITSVNFDNIAEMTIGNNSPQRLFQAARQNEEFLMLFADRAYKHFFNDGVLTPQDSLARWMNRTNEVDRTIIAESARWGDAMGGSAYTYQDWLSQQDFMQGEFFPQRTDVVMGQLRSHGLYPLIAAPDFNQHGGAVASGFSLTIPSAAALDGSLEFDGSGDFVELIGYHGVTGTQARTVAAWINTESTGTVLSWGQEVTSGKWLFRIDGSGAIRVSVQNGFTTGTTVVNDGRWHHVAAVLADDGSPDVGKIQFYVDGVADAVSSFQGLPIDTAGSTTVKIGGFSGGNFKGRIAEVHIFDEALSGSQVHALGMTGVATAATPVGRWRLDDNSGSTAIDTAGTNDGTLMGNPQWLAASTIYLTLDGTDPRMTGGAIDPGALQYAGPVSLTNSRSVKARVWEAGQWSALADVTFAVGLLVETLRITEIMYHPADPPLGDLLAEYIELQNVGGEPVNLNLVQFTRGIDFAFPDLELAPNDHVVVVRDLTAFVARYGLTPTVAGEFTGVLDNGGERIVLEDAIGRTIHDFAYKDGWFDITDGGGFSLTLIDPAHPDLLSWGEKSSWRASTFVGGSPGAGDVGPSPGDVVINEVLAHSDLLLFDFIELHNTTDSEIDISGWFLSDSGQNDPNLMKYPIPASTWIPGHDYIVFTQDDDFGAFFALSEFGETVYLTSGLDGNGKLTGYREKEDFGASENGVAFGKYQKSTGTSNFVAMQSNTPGGANDIPRVGPVVISEIMYHPDWLTGSLYNNEEFEYIEITNISGGAVDLYDNIDGQDVGWRFTDGIDYTFPIGTTIPAGGTLIVARNPAAFTARFSLPTLGPYDSKLSNGGEKVELSRPGELIWNLNYSYIRVDRVNYSDGSQHDDFEGINDPWPPEPDGTGKSLSRIIMGDYGNDSANWQADDPSPDS